jgi:hypothetical protein
MHFNQVHDQLRTWACDMYKLLQYPPTCLEWQECLQGREGDHEDQGVQGDWTSGPDEALSTAASG